MATSKPIKINRPAILPANVPGIVNELHRLAAVDKAEVAGHEPRNAGGPSLVVRGK